MLERKHATMIPCAMRRPRALAWHHHRRRPGEGKLMASRKPRVLGVITLTGRSVAAVATTVAMMRAAAWVTAEVEEGLRPLLALPGKVSRPSVIHNKRPSTQTGEGGTVTRQWRPPRLSLIHI